MLKSLLCQIKTRMDWKVAYVNLWTPNNFAWIKFWRESVTRPSVCPRVPHAHATGFLSYKKSGLCLPRTAGFKKFPSPDFVKTTQFSKMTSRAAGKLKLIKEWSWERIASCQYIIDQSSFLHRQVPKYFEVITSSFAGVLSINTCGSSRVREELAGGGMIEGTP